jgi:hypothetical protein
MYVSICLYVHLNQPFRDSFLINLTSNCSVCPELFGFFLSFQAMNHLALYTLEFGLWSLLITWPHVYLVLLLICWSRVATGPIVERACCRAYCWSPDHVFTAGSTVDYQTTCLLQVLLLMSLPRVCCSSYWWSAYHVFVVGPTVDQITTCLLQVLLVISCHGVCCMSYYCWSPASVFAAGPIIDQPATCLLYCRSYCWSVDHVLAVGFSVDHLHLSAVGPILDLMTSCLL